MHGSFLLFTEIEDVVDTLTDEQAGLLFKAILDYESGKEPDLTNEAVRIAFIPIKRSLIKSDSNYEKQKEAKSEAGKRGAEKRWNKTKDTSENITEDGTAIAEHDTPCESIAEMAVNVNDNDNDNDYVKEKENKKKSADKPHRSFTPPTLEEVRLYCAERRNGVDPQHFMDFYESKGWFIGKNKMKDWKAAVRTWEQRNRSSPSKIEIDENFRKAMRASEVVDFGI